MQRVVRNKLKYAASKGAAAIVDMADVVHDLSKDILETLLILQAEDNEEDEQRFCSKKTITVSNDCVLGSRWAGKVLQ